MAIKANKNNYRLTDILYSADVCSKLRIAPKKLQRWEKKGLPFTRSQHTNLKMYLESEIIEWLSQKK